MQVSRDERLDIVHAHYAIPHATAAYLARQILGVDGLGRGPARDHDAAWHRHHAARQRPVVLGDRRVLHRAIGRRDRRVREPAGATRFASSGSTCDIRVIPNFVDCRRTAGGTSARFARGSRPRGEKLLIHVSNFRPVKRVKAVVEVFARVRARVPVRLLMVGDGPDLADASRLARALGVADDVEFLGEQDQVVPLLSAADVFLLPSAQESFGLARARGHGV